MTVVCINISVCIIVYTIITACGPKSDLFISGGTIGIVFICVSVFVIVDIIFTSGLFGRDARVGTLWILTVFESISVVIDAVVAVSISKPDFIIATLTIGICIICIAVCIIIQVVVAWTDRFCEESKYKILF